MILFDDLFTNVHMLSTSVTKNFISSFNNVTYLFTCFALTISNRGLTPRYTLTGDGSSGRFIVNYTINS